ncbi:MAG: hypothetical protein ACE366_24775 [Bradymonadia bacterium]
MSLTLTRPLHGALLFHVLSHLDLGADAANLYDLRTRDVDAPWRAHLLDAWHRTPPPDRLMIHALAHWTQSVEALLTGLEAHRWSFTRTDAGGRLADLLLAALLIELPEVERLHDADVSTPRHQRFLTEGAPAVEACRRALWGGTPPALMIMDCDALGLHGRGGALDPLGIRRGVAISLEAPLEHAVCQIVHEEIHPITDPQVPVTTHRSTAKGDPGFAHHKALEAAAVSAGFELFDIHAPAFSEAYRRWCSRFGVQSAPTQT